jgi:hypothetical protein
MTCRFFRRSSATPKLSVPIILRLQDARCRLVTLDRMDSPHITTGYSGKQQATAATSQVWINSKMKRIPRGDGNADGRGNATSTVPLEAVSDDLEIFYAESGIVFVATCGIVHLAFWMMRKWPMWPSLLSQYLAVVGNFTGTSHGRYGRGCVRTG